jgi:signal transduction histidine kinase
MPDPHRDAGDLSPALASLTDPDLLVELLSSNPAGVVLVEATADLTVVYCNDSFQRWAPLGHRPLAGSSLADAFSWVDRPNVRTACREVIRSGRPLHWRAAPYHVDQGGHPQMAYWSLSLYPVRGPDGRPGHLLGFAMDVTDPAALREPMKTARSRILSALGGLARHLASDAELDAFFAELGETVAQLIGAGRVAFWRFDAATETIAPARGAFGFSPDELAELGGRPCRPGGRDAMERVVFDGLVLHGSVPRDTTFVPWTAGEQRLGAVAAYASTRPGGFTEEDVWVLQAAATAAALVCEHRRADEALAALREREAGSLRQQIEQSMELEQLKADFLRLASHELRGPLGIVRGYVSMIEDGTLGAPGEQVAAVMPVLRGKLEEMNQLINEMLETARLEDSALQLRLAGLDLRDVVREAVTALGPLARAEHALTTEVPPVPVPVQGDRSRLVMVVTNLLHNAIKYSPDGGEIVVRCAVDGSVATVSVTDHGIGIAAADQSRLFTRFGRIATERTAGIPGTGLGLYLARDLTRRHGGDVQVSSKPGRGSTFTVTLPLAQAAQPR